MVHAGNINKTTAIPLPTNEEWRQAISEDHDIGYIQRILSIPDKTPIDSKELRKNGCVKPFQKGHLELGNGSISYYDTLLADRVRKLRLRVVPVKFRQVVMSECHVSPLSGNSYDQETLFIVLARFWWPMENNEVSQLIRACAHCQLVNS